LTFPNDIVGSNLVMTTATIETNGGNNSTINTDIQTGWNITQTGTTEMNDYELDDLTRETTHDGQNMSRAR
jgi:hypothetical protein